MRVHFSGDVAIEKLRRSFAPEAQELKMRWELSPADARPRVLIMVSRHLHCLLDLLNRVRLGTTAPSPGNEGILPWERRHPPLATISGLDLPLRQMGPTRPRIPPRFE